MSLTSALNTAKSSLTSTQTQMALVSRNIANVNTEGATRKYANVVTGAGGLVEVRSISQSANAVLFRNMLDSTSNVAQFDAIDAGLTRIDEMLGDIANGKTPAALISSLSDALKAYAASPNSYEFGRKVADAANDVAQSLKAGTDVVDSIRRDADNDLIHASAEMNEILARIKTLNEEVVAGTAGNRDITDVVDKRDQAVVELSKYVCVNAQIRGNNDLLLYTDSGVTLFDKEARNVSFQATYPMVDGQDGNGLRIDGILVTGSNATLPIKSGKVVGLIELRDKVATTYQSQLDEMARALIAATAERPTMGSDVTGLFTATNLTGLGAISSVEVGAFSAGTLANGNVVEFDLVFGNQTYKVSGTVSTADLASSTAYAARLQALIANATPTTGTGTLGTGRITVTADTATNRISLSATGMGVKPSLSVANFASKADNATGTAYDPTPRTGGLRPASADTTNTLVPGLARQIAVAQAVVTDASKIRDGVSVTYNTASGSGYTARINALTSALDARQNFGIGTDSTSTGTLVSFAASSQSWLQARRAAADSSSDYQQTLLTRTKETLSNETGINLDAEMLRTLDLQKSYQASSKVLTTVNEMLKTLMNII